MTWIWRLRDRLPRKWLHHRGGPGHDRYADPPSKRLTAELVDDCRAFFQAQLAEHFEQRHQSVPVWAWTNLLAHGSEQDLRSDQTLPEQQLAFDGQWHRARSYLAAELLALAGRSCPLVDLQRDVLVPLELDLASRPEVNGWSPPQWVSCVETAVYKHTRS